MPPQRSFADVEYDGQPRQTRRERFLQRMDALMPWARLEARIRPVYPTGERGRPRHLPAAPARNAVNPTPQGALPLLWTAGAPVIQSFPR